jgi:hypothetical protein
VTFVLFGLAILAINVITDSYYFVKRMFDRDLKTITTSKAESLLEHNSLRHIMSYSSKFLDNNIKSVTNG